MQPVSRPRFMSFPSPEYFLPEQYTPLASSEVALYLAACILCRSPSDCPVQPNHPELPEIFALHNMFDFTHTAELKKDLLLHNVCSTAAGFSYLFLLHGPLDLYCFLRWGVCKRFLPPLLSLISLFWTWHCSLLPMKKEPLKKRL